MYILNERTGAIWNTDFAVRIFLADTSDSVLLSAEFQPAEKPVTMERYHDREEALGAIMQLFDAMRADDAAFILPDSRYYHDEWIKKDARTRRKGGS